MNVLIDARNPIEYLRLRRIAGELSGVNVYRTQFFLRGKLQRHYDVIVYARSDNENMAAAEQWQCSWGKTIVILIMDSEDKHLEAMHFHVFDYLTRPLSEADFAQSLRDATEYFAGRFRPNKAL
ncbi:MAG: hypothetical protein J5449_05430 [Oscillospiraceae bacterium]|nr:hypothetical protein [Oscillospiraceae bacterium]